MENEYAKQWDQIGGTPEANRAVATEMWEHPNYFNLSGLFSTTKALEVMFKFFGKDLHRKNFLELGCGTGRETQYFKDVFYSMHALDYSQNMIDKAKFKIKDNFSIDFISNDGCDIPFPDNYFDIIYSYIVLQHCHREVVLSYFREAQRSLKSDGIFMFQLHIGKEHKEPVDYLSYSTWTEEEIKEALKDMEIVSFPENNQMDFIIYKKK